MSTLPVTVFIFHIHQRCNRKNIDVIRIQNNKDYGYKAYNNKYHKLEQDLILLIYSNC